jgi:catechol 2,3-dioxygenase-like lactoylglutathione lyase family enzyme
MANIKRINHVTLVVSDLEEACAFYEQEFGLEAVPAFQVDFPTQFFRLTEDQQLHLTEWEDSPSFRGHVCFQVENFNEAFTRMKALGRIDLSPFGKVRRLPDGCMQMFVRDPSGNLLEISSTPDTPVNPAIFEDDDLVESEPGLYVSERNDERGFKSATATLLHGTSNA